MQGRATVAPASRMPAPAGSMGFWHAGILNRGPV
ncbi:protein of unknown function [Hyphomicrobium sp. 1Nfss2.1]